MAEEEFEEELEGEEGGAKAPGKRLVPISTAESFETMLADSLPKKTVVVVAWLIPGNEHSDAALRFVKDFLRQEAYRSALVLTVDPSALPELAQKNSLHAVPTFQYYYKELTYTYVGSNPEKFQVYLAKLVEKRQEEIGLTLYLQRNAPTDATLAAGEKSELENNAFTLGFGWTPPEEGELHIEVLAFLLTEAEKIPSDRHAVFYGNPTAPGGALTWASHLTGKADPAEDDCTIAVNLDAAEEDIVAVEFVMVIMKAQEREQSFEQVSGTYARVFDPEQRKALAMLSLEGAASGAATVVARATRSEESRNTWVLTAMAEAIEGTLDDVFTKYQPPKTGKKKAKQ
eukprot:RCo046445